MFKKSLAELLNITNTNHKWSKTLKIHSLVLICLPHLFHWTPLKTQLKNWKLKSKHLFTLFHLIKKIVLQYQPIISPNQSLFLYRYFAPFFRSYIVSFFAYLSHSIFLASFDFKLNSSSSFIYLFLNAFTISPVFPSATTTNFILSKSKLSKSNSPISSISKSSSAASFASFIFSIIFFGSL